nr:M20/M25/M40 family metallo-hydrolase [Candidatus Baldrarchaeota archaeon]
MREEDVIKLAQSLISTPNVEDTAKQLVQFLEKKNIYLEEISYEDNPVIIAKAEGREKKNPLIFVTHLDVAPPGPEEFWSFPPFSGQIEGNVLKGKGGLASVAVALADLVSEGIKPERCLPFGTS